MISIEHIHPMIVHFPIVFFLTLAALDIIALFKGAEITGRSAIGNISAGLAVLSGISSIVAYAFGDEALEIAEAGGFSSVIAENHEALGIAVAILFTIWALIRGYLWMSQKQVSGVVKKLMVIFEIGGAALVLTTAYFGGLLVYDLGVNVSLAVQ